jgi:CheY-like chemotaxis protein
MIADDTWTNHVALKNVISKIIYLNHEIIIHQVNDRRQAVESFSSLNKTQNPQNIHLIIMDLNMREMDGD